MQMQFTLVGISGVELMNRFLIAIEEEEVGYDDMASARVVDSTWVTAWSGFKYTIMNPVADEQAVVEYDGACRAFLTQNLLPGELHGETTRAVVVAGSALERHEADKFEMVSASDLAETYGLMQKAGRHHTGTAESLRVCLAAIQGAREVDQYIRCKTTLGNTNSRAYAAPNTGGSGCINTEDGDPAVYVTLLVGGELVTLEIQLHPWGEQSTTEYIFRRAIGWIDRLKLVL